MSTTATPRKDATTDVGIGKVPLKLEVVTIPVSDVDRAKKFYGKLGWEDIWVSWVQKRQRYEARDEFDKAVDEVLTSGLDVRADQRLQTFYLELVSSASIARKCR